MPVDGTLARLLAREPGAFPGKSNPQAYPQPMFDDETSVEDSRDASTPLLDGPDDWGVYAEPYWRAAEKILDEARSDSFLLHPGLFLMRHYVELFLKRQLHQSGTPVPRTHNLSELWKRVRALDAVTENEHVTPTVLSTLDEAIDGLAQIDPNAETFRYPVDKHGRARGFNGAWFSARDMLRWSQLIQMQLGLLEAAVDMQAMDRETEREMAEYYGP